MILISSGPGEPTFTSLNSKTSGKGIFTSCFDSYKICSDDLGVIRAYRGISPLDEAKYILKDYNFPVFPDDFAYYLLNDNKTLIMISATKSLKSNFKFDIFERKLELYPVNGKFDFIISSIAKYCGYSDFKENYKCNFYKPLISSTLIN